jgi:hypothetical protein
MAFIISGGNVISFAEYDDVAAIDQRVFEANEGLTIEIVEDILIRSTTRILNNFVTTEWWRTYYLRQTAGSYDPLIYTSGLLAIPAPDPNNIKDRQADFTDMCVWFALSQYIYPKIADFSNLDNAERVKIGFMNEKYRSMFQELIDDGSWYDFSGDGTITKMEKMPTRSNVVRVR